MKWTDDDGVSLAYTRDGSRGPTLIAIHEMGGTIDSFADIVPLLTRDARLLRYDQRGAGMSEKPRAPFDLGSHVSDLERVIAHAGLQPPYSLIGLAAGSAIAVAFAHRHPQSVSALALCAAALGVSPDRRGYLTDRAALAEREGMRAVEAASLSRSYPQIYRDRNPARYAAYRGTFLAHDPVSYAQINMAFADADVSDAAAALRVPCLLLAGEHDELRPPDDVRALTEQIRHAEFDVIEAGHIMPVQSPDATADRLRRFLQLG